MSLGQAALATALTVGLTVADAPVSTRDMMLGSGAQSTKPLTHAVPPRGDERAPAWSPDAARIAYEGLNDGNWDLYLVPSVGGLPTRLTTHPAADRMPSWSPHGDRLVFQSTRDGRPDLYLLTVGDGRVEQLTSSPGEETFPAWSPDGRAIAFTAPDAAGRLNLHTIDVTTRQVKALTTDSTRAVWPRWSPAGDRLAFFSRRDTDGAWDDVYVMRLADSTVTRVTHSVGHDFCPTWSPDGTRLAFASVPLDGPRELRVVDLDGRLHARMGTGVEGITEPAWSPTGGRIAYAVRVGGLFRIVVDALSMPAGRR